MFMEGVTNILDKINTLKSILNKELESKNVSDEEIIIISQKLDRLITDYYNSSGNDKSNIEDIQE